ncbi:hypothetical protein [Actinomadura rubrisoli]|uniref:hypothetical protein n=1 Tax=Actinomadura rubrisoli TaxID=2530368 RepID=UPI00140507E3|nr:hypothetical protein [Actinomadura rubrisoli]
MTRTEELRPLLFSIAYRILGSVSEADDGVDAVTREWTYQGTVVAVGGRRD